MIRCPKCGEKFNPVDAMIQAGWREAMLLLPSFGKQGKLVFEYVELFGINPLKIKSGKVLRLLKEVKQVIDGKYFAYNRKTHTISNAGVFEALQICCNKNFSAPIENHNYLKKVMVSISEREEKERGLQGERDLRKKEEKIRGRRSEVRGREGTEVGSQTPDVGKKTADEYKRQKGIENLADQVGKNM